MEPTIQPPVTVLDEQSLSRLVSCPILFDDPDRAVAPPSWLEHIPFAFWIVDALRPTVLVELGTHSGNSYAAFAQAIQRLKLPTAGYAVDTWRGDPQSGFYDESVFKEWSAYHDRRFSSFSRLVRSTFAEAVEHFPDGGVDLLHIDGYHTFDAVSADFELWQPKMSARGVVLIHDINVREGEFGAWRFWEQIRGEYPSLAFLHGHGLGVLGLGADLPESVAWLLSHSPEPSSGLTTIRALFARLGATVSLRYVDQLRDAEQLSDVAADANRRLDDVAGDLVQARQQAHDLSLEAMQLRAALAAGDDALAESQSRAVQLEEQLASVSREHGQALDYRQRVAAQFRQQLDVEWRRRRAAEAERDRLASQTVVHTLEPLNQDLAPPSSRPLKRADVSRGGARAHRSNRVPATLGLLRSPLPFLSRRRALRDAYVIAASGLFDEQYYRRCNPDIAASALTPLAHFVITGAREHRNPHPLFDAAWYVSTNPNLGPRAINPLVHYVDAGARERRDPHPLFSASFYIGNDAGAAERAANPLAHYVVGGWDEGRSPHPLFDPLFYLEQNPPVAAAGIDPLAHFLEHAREHGNPHPLFDVGYYLQHHPDVAAAGVNPLIHYRLCGWAEGRKPHPLFDPVYYREMNPDVREAAVEPLSHFLTIGASEGRNPNPFFDCSYYLACHPDVARSGVNPLVHFVRVGWREGKRASPLFDTAYYLSTFSDVRLSGRNPLIHYVESGRSEGRRAVVDDAEAAAAAINQPQLELKASALGHSPVERPTVLCLSHVMPWPPRAGNEYRIYRMLRWLRDQGYRIIPVIAPMAGDHVEPGAVRALADQFSNAVLCHDDGRIEYILHDVPDVLGSLTGEFTGLIAPLLDEGSITDGRGKQLLQIDRTFCHDTLIATVLRLHQVLGPYVLLAEYIWMSRVLPLIPGRVLKVVDTIDVFSTKRDKVLQFGIDDWHIEPHEEQQRLQHADLVLAIQDEERHKLQQMVPRTPVVTAGVDFDVVDDAGSPDGRRILYVASDNPMNKKGLQDFLRFAWPRIRRQVPDAELIVAGAVSRTLLYDAPGVTRLGSVADLRPLYTQARLVINPAVAGTGLKIKTLEALCHLRPLVTWPNGTDGLAPELAAFCLTASDWYEFSQHVVRLLEAEQPQRFSQADRDLVVRLTSPSTVYRDLTAAADRFFKNA